MAFSFTLKVAAVLYKLEYLNYLAKTVLRQFQCWCEKHFRVNTTRVLDEMLDCVIDLFPLNTRCCIVGNIPGPVSLRKLVVSSNVLIN